MVVRLVCVIMALLLTVASAEARRVALVIGQNGYPGGASATVGLPPLDNPRNDARRFAALLAKHGFEVLSCDGKQPGCTDLTRAGMLAALTGVRGATGAPGKAGAVQRVEVPSG